MNINKIIFTITAIVLITTGCDTVTPTNDDGSIKKEENTPVSERVKSMVEKYVERQYDSGAPAYSWAYNAENELVEFSEYIYDEFGRNSTIKSYSSEPASVESSLGEYVFTFEDGTYNITKCVLYDKSKNIIMQYEATYNDKGRYLTYVSQDSDGTVLESRVSTYDASGDNYLTETYYADVARTVKLEEYISEYDPVFPGRYIREMRYINVNGGTTLSGDTTSDDYKKSERTIEYLFSWSKGNDKMHYLQQSFDDSGVLLDIIQYRFNDFGDKISRSYFSHGKLQSYWNYSYSESYTYLSELTYYDENDVITNLMAQRKYTTENGANMYEKISYSYANVNSVEALASTRSFDNDGVNWINPAKLKTPVKNNRSY
ncbi:MAG: hypothetical protein A2015_12775 [Spirochaetes bacterium GWF1_31_7]|nr:MAG: hypothetical protein A2Y30_10565 [Spirochaetes bacterium GWE1_32_154]OHD49256.1 MAG: hypothetical protein A2Y29_16195 [Spirochaetes bacterium GWE2_31_10]OHD51818.1 MAG: hypothetical protein A2015_12775 [Spirochaetes bacterium GWF1_31_7]OHD79996.1 MAG: hypothetical protein A2355_13270 [Spirochaetes bacterium RIFOXYB1_FULL_32_8]HBD95324.1 hypothetical protein [Spirochaetia bacterium]